LDFFLKVEVRDDLIVGAVPDKERTPYLKES
jgi:hypothetical protein